MIWTVVATGRAAESLYIVKYEFFFLSFLRVGARLTTENKNTQESLIFLSLQVGYSTVAPRCSPKRACNSLCVAWAALA